MIRRILLVFAALLVIAIGLNAGAVAFMMWPFLWYDATVIDIPRVAPAAVRSEPVLVGGVAMRDITPPPGLPKFGYSSIGHDGDGFRNRLRARAFYLRSPGQRPVVVVQTDLGAGSDLLHHHVAARIAAHSDIDAGDLSITSTHTHSGPGLYLGSNFYNAHGVRHGGFDPAMLEFLGARIADAVVEAYETRRPARIASGRRQVWGATRNRSIEAWLRNPVAKGLEESHQLEFAAVNPWMTMLRIDLQAPGGGFHPAGAFTLFSIHGTGIPADSDPYHADVWAYFAREVEWAIRDEYDPPWPPVHGAFQATHGDTTPAWRPGLRGETETRRIGTLLGREAWQLFRQLGPQLSSDVLVRSAMREVDLLELPPEERAPLCDRAILGAATVGAARGDEHFASWMWPFARGYPRQWFASWTCHGAKHWLGSVFQLLMPADIFPHRVVFHAMQFGDLLVFTAPWEITLESGNAARAAIAAAIPDAGRYIIEISSVANGFFAYSTTAEEYSLQFYEGGHTIYGPGTTAFLARHSGSLFGGLFERGSFAELPQGWRFELSTTPLFPPPAPASGQRETVREPVLERGDATTGAFWSYRYRDVGRGAIELDRPLVRIETRDANGDWQPLLEGGRPVTDQEYDIQVLHRGDLRGGMGVYELRWYQPDFDAAREHRFHIEPRAGLPEFASPEF
jgi:neutral ceramidase